MKKKAILAIGIIALFIGMAFIPAVTSIKTPTLRNSSSGPQWALIQIGTGYQYDGNGPVYPVACLVYIDGAHARRWVTRPHIRIGIVARDNSECTCWILTTSGTHTIEVYGKTDFPDSSWYDSKTVDIQPGFDLGNFFTFWWEH